MVFVIGITLFTVLVWVALDSYHTISSRDRVKEVESLTKPLNPNLNFDTLDKIEAKKEYQPNEVETYLIPTPTLSEETEEGVAGETAIEQTTEAQEGQLQEGGQIGN